MSLRLEPPYRGREMKIAKAAKFPHSVQLFKFCQKVLSQRKQYKVHDQEVGAILGFNPSDCSHWKRGKKNVRSVFALEKLAATLKVEIALIYDIVSGGVGLDEALYEYNQARSYRDCFNEIAEIDAPRVQMVRQRCTDFVVSLHKQCEFVVPPLYLPEVLRFFSFVSAQSAGVVDRLSRILRVKPGQYCIQFKKGDLKPQTRMSVVSDLARVLLQGERERFPELGKIDEDLAKFEQYLFVLELLAPRHMLRRELGELDSRRNMITELATLFWVPKALVGFQLQDILRTRPLERVREAPPEAEQAAAARQLHL